MITKQLQYNKEKLMKTNVINKLKEEENQNLTNEINKLKIALKQKENNEVNSLKVNDLMKKLKTVGKEHEKELKRLEQKFSEVNLFF